MELSFNFSLDNIEVGEIEYGRINIEVAQRKVRKDDSDEEDTDVSPETGQESKVEIKKSVPQGNSIPNGVVTNGYSNHNSTSLINRQDNLILLPEPPKIPTPPHHDTDISEASLNKDDNVIGQRHGGFLGVVQRALARASPHIWFERSEAKDRHAVASRLKEHVSNPNNPPILIFPEGTCINNTSVMQFKKGSFEVDSVIYPVAIKYDPRFGDAFWDSSRYSYIQYLYMMMTSWAIVCEVWYLPPMYRKEGENAIDFANRVKSVIAKQGGLVDLVW
ncbi:phospholipid acyltransferase [Holotrichia oblita]|uniref:Phospholipid acyltransferase n=1 Tax=Holotrichia oblita TaxID=644536 RepID=A0ACB9SY59_HOLOL|nr:phospholipid acyltransferase [Holotrichia oblita]